VQASSLSIDTNLDRLRDMSWDVSNLVTGIAVPAAVIFFLRLMRKYAPANKATTHGELGVPDEDLKGLQWGVGAAIILVGVGLGYGVYRLLLFANQSFANADGPAAFQLLPTKALWIFLPLFGALCVSWDITLYLLYFVEDHNRIQRYLAWSDARAGFNSTRVLRWMTLVLALPVCILTLLAVPMHSSVREDGITVRQYASRASRHYPYSRAQRLAWVDGFRGRDGVMTKRAEILVDFDDGFRWSSVSNRDFESSPDPGLVEFLQAKTGLPVLRAETEDDLPATPR
jgi:hypothetical protein